MKLSEWSKQQGIHYRTAWQWFKDGKLPVPVVQTASGTILIQEPRVEKSSSATIYCRVSSSDQKKDLDAQIARFVLYAQTQNLSVSQVVTEIGSGYD